MPNLHCKKSIQFCISLCFRDFREEILIKLEEIFIKFFQYCFSNQLNKCLLGNHDLRVFLEGELLGRALLSGESWYIVFILHQFRNKFLQYVLTCLSLFCLSETTPGSVFTNHSREHSLSFLSRVINLNVAQLLIKFLCFSL